MKAVFRFSALACIPLYAACTLMAHLHQPGSPLSNWLSDYGDSLRNPSGAIWYNVGCIITALLLAVFYIGMYRWYAGRGIGKKYVISYIGAQVSGMAASVFLVLTAVFPLGLHTETHSFFSQMNMIGMDSFMVFVAVAYFLSPNKNKATGVFGVLLAAFNIVTTNAFTDLYIAQWIYIAGFMAFMVLITIEYGRIHAPGASHR